MALVDRHTPIAENVVLLDGLTGTGKTMMAPILSTLRRVEVQRIEHIYEFACNLRFLGRVEEDAAVELIRMYIDLASYNVMIGRESNFRWKDLSGVLSNPGGWRYVRRLFQADGDAAMNRIHAERPILQIVCHQALGAGASLFRALEDRLTVVEMVRHPLYLLEHWYSYIHRFGTDPRDFTIWLKHHEDHVPWFASGWEDKYLASNNMDRVIYSIDWLTRLAEDTVASLPESQQCRVRVIPFERFVVEPWPYLQQVADSLGTEVTPSTRRALRKQKVPRRLTLDGLDRPIYRRYNWRPPPKDSSESDELAKRREYAQREASPEASAVLDSMCSAYDQRYLDSAAAGPLNRQLSRPGSGGTSK